MIYTVTLNPAVDKVLFLDEFQRSRTNRLSRTTESVGGKGTHVSINLKLQGVPSIALGIALGENGRKVIDLLQNWEIDAQFLHYALTGMESRTNYQVIETAGNSCTMLTEKGSILPEWITDELLEQVKNLIKPGDKLVLAGDASNVEDVHIYSKISALAREQGARVILDASGAYLKQGLKSNPFMIKPNLEELSYISNRELKTESEILSAMQELDEYQVSIIATTMGRNGALVKYGREYYRISPIQVKTINDGGCGDAFLSAILAGIEKKMGVEELLKSAAAIASASAESDLTVGFDLDRAEELIYMAVVEKMSV